MWFNFVYVFVKKFDGIVYGIFNIVFDVMDIVNV